MSGVTSAVVIGAAAVGAAASIYSSRQQAKATRAASAAQQSALEKAEQQQDQATNRQYQNEADVGALLEQNTNSQGAANLTGGYVSQGTLGSGGLLGG